MVTPSAGDLDLRLALAARDGDGDGDGEALARLLARHNARLRRICALILGNLHDAGNMTALAEAQIVGPPMSPTPRA